MTQPISYLLEYTVTQLSSEIQGVVSSTFSKIKLKGEISGLKRHTSGHLYLTIKDDKSVIDAICWRGTVASLKHAPEEGLEAICQGRVTTYPARSKYQFIIEKLEPAGEGALLKLLEDRKRKLAAEGLFSAEHKKKLPPHPQVIGVITSETGAVIQDILHRLRERFPLHVILWPVAVQGDNAADQISKAIKGFETLPNTFPVPDLIIVARGGGSLEDLWCFNEEEIVRAIYNCSIPTISAVGHETDYTLIDLAADCRAPTPTAAAEIAVPMRSTLLDTLATRGHRLSHHMRSLLTQAHNRLGLSGRVLRSPRQIVEEWLQKVDDKSEQLQYLLQAQFEKLTVRLNNVEKRLRLQRTFGKDFQHKLHYLTQRITRIRPTQKMETLVVNIEDTNVRIVSALRSIIDKASIRLDGMSALLRTLSYKGVLERGYTLVESQKKNILATRARMLETGDGVEIIFADGKRSAKIN